MVTSGYHLPNDKNLLCFLKEAPVKFITGLCLVTTERKEGLQEIDIPYHDVHPSDFIIIVLMVMEHLIFRIYIPCTSSLMVIHIYI